MRARFLPGARRQPLRQVPRTRPRSGTTASRAAPPPLPTKRRSTHCTMGPSLLSALDLRQTERLTLRRLTVADATALFQTTGDADVMRYWAPGPDAAVADAQR